MPIITKLQAQKRTAGRYSIYIDDAYAFGLSDLDLSNSGLRAGQELSEKEVAEWQAKAGEAKAYNAALSQLAYRRRSVREIQEYLRRKDYEPSVIAGITERLTDAGLVDDHAFAAAWIADRQLLKPKSKRVLQGELMQKGIANDIIRDALSELDDDGQLEVVFNLAERKSKQSQYIDRTKLTAYLARQGFGYDHIKKALARLDDIS